MNRIAQELQAARKLKGLSQAELGAKVGMPQSHISNIESGKRDLRLSSLLEIARILDLEPIFVPRILVPAVRSLIAGDDQPRPAWLPDQPEDDSWEELA
jgi:HTH-type transcriptional regulator / antitoxin HipB